MSQKLLYNGVFVDLEHENYTYDSAVIVNDSKIEYVGTIMDLAPSFIESCETFDLTGKYIVPGFIDAHIHIFEEPDGDLCQDFRIDEGLDDALIRGNRHLDQMLAAGITAAREMGAIQRRNIILRDLVRGMDNKTELVVCGNPITHTDGHYVSRCRIVDNEAEMQQAIEEEMEAGADFIKINNTIRVGMSQRVLEVAVKTTESLGTFVACHSYTHAAMKVAIDAGVKTLEHVADFDQTLIGEMQDKSIIPIPTFVAAYDSIPSVNPDAQVELLTQTIPDSTYHDFVEWFNWQNQNLPALLRSGIEFGIGTDSGFVPTTFDSLHRELELLCRLGANPWQVLRAATIGSAKAMGKENVMGSLKPGMTANVVILEQDPISDIRNSKSIYGVVLKGKFHRA
jgi:imidazolonepropionase-like amidohydrolase